MTIAPCVNGVLGSVAVSTVTHFFFSTRNTLNLGQNTGDVYNSGIPPLGKPGALAQIATSDSTVVCLNDEPDRNAKAGHL